jgi:hypothetical protein
MAARRPFAGIGDLGLMGCNGRDFVARLSRQALRRVARRVILAIACAISSGGLQLQSQFKICRYE